MRHIYARNFRELVDMSMTEFVSNLERELMTKTKEERVPYSYKNLKTFMKESFDWCMRYDVT
jgi:hypothetical protein